MFSSRLSRVCFGSRYRSALPRSPLATRFQTLLPRLPPSPLASPSASLASFKSALPARPSPCRSFSSSIANMGSLAPYQRKHKITVVGSGNWYALHIFFLLFLFPGSRFMLSAFFLNPWLRLPRIGLPSSPMPCCSSVGIVETNVGISLAGAAPSPKSSPRMPLATRTSLRRR